MASERKGALRRNSHDKFIDVMTGKERTVGQWEAEQKEYRAKRAGTTGNYNPRTGERSYGAHYTGRRKSMRRGGY